MNQYEITVEGMGCNRCEERVTNAVRQVEGVHGVKANHETNTVEITADDGTQDDVSRAIHDAGYDIPA